MKLILLLFTCFVVIAADPVEPPKLVRVDPYNLPWTHVILKWTHPSAVKFQIRMVSPTMVSPDYVLLEEVRTHSKEANREYYDMIRLTAKQCVFSVRAVAGTNRTEWSNPIAIEKTE